MAVVKYNDMEVKLLARLMRAEAESEGVQGMLMVGNVGVNRVRASCLDFKEITSISQWYINTLEVSNQLFTVTFIRLQEVVK